MRGWAQIRFCVGNARWLLAGSAAAVGHERTISHVLVSFWESAAGGCSRGDTADGEPAVLPADTGTLVDLWGHYRCGLRHGGIGPRSLPGLVGNQPGR